MLYLLTTQQNAREVIEYVRDLIETIGHREKVEQVLSEQDHQDLELIFTIVCHATQADNINKTRLIQLVCDKLESEFRNYILLHF